MACNFLDLCTMTLFYTVTNAYVIRMASYVLCISVCLNELTSGWLLISSEFRRDIYVNGIPSIALIKCFHQTLLFKIDFHL